MSGNRCEVTVHSCDRRDSLAWLSLGRIHGGKGGGGTSPTPEGLSAAAPASKIEAQADALR